jgi:chemotaxis methyl-accepting protein methylase
MVDFRTLNLLEDFTTLGVFDVIFCRNVLIYFDQQTKGDVFDRLADQLAPTAGSVLGSGRIGDRPDRGSHRMPTIAGSTSSTIR